MQAYFKPPYIMYEFCQYCRNHVKFYPVNLLSNICIHFTENICIYKLNFTIFTQLFQADPKHYSTVLSPIIIDVSIQIAVRITKL